MSDSDAEEALTNATQAEISLREKESELLYLNNKVRSEQIEVFEMHVKVAEAEVTEASQKLSETRLRAPFDGIVLKYMKREGEGVSQLIAPEPVVLFGDLSRFQVRAEIDERYARLLAGGQAAQVYGLNLGGCVYTGSIIEVERVMGDKTVFSRSGSERKDLQVIQATIEMGEDFIAPVGLQVRVRLKRS